MKQNLTGLKGQLKILVGDFSTPLPVLVKDRTSRQEIGRNICISLLSATNK
jgi:hypothetical protein